MATTRGGVTVGHIVGLDTVRFACALTVVFGHFGFVPVPRSVDASRGVARLFVGIYNNLFSGPAAVIVFFVVSGFCIHYPYRTNVKIPLLSYYTRRYLRILVPMAAAIALGNALGIRLTLLSDSILWSLVCEEIYYLMYPLLRRLRERVSFRAMIAVAYVAAALVVLRDPRSGNYAAYGAAWNWIVGLPCWLLGCELAERVALPRPAPTSREIWAWRLTVWALATVCSVLRFHTPLGYPWTLNAFALVAALWLLREIAYRREFAPPGWLERGGRWSYSIYLVHLQSGALFERLGLPLHSAFLVWLGRVGFTLGACYAFARLIEFPSHRLARHVGTRLLARTKALSPREA